MSAGHSPFPPLDLKPPTEPEPFAQEKINYSRNLACQIVAEIQASEALEFIFTLDPQHFDQEVFERAFTVFYRGWSLRKTIAYAGSLATVEIQPAFVVKVRGAELQLVRRPSLWALGRKRIKSLLSSSTPG